MEVLDLTEHLPISLKWLKQIQDATALYKSSRSLYFLGGHCRSLRSLRYVKCQNELSAQEGVLFKGIPTGLSPERDAPESSSGLPWSKILSEKS